MFASSKTRKIVFTVLRIGICVVALWWVLKSVTLNDYVRLRDGRTAQLLQLDDDQARVRYADGREERIPADAIDTKKDGTPAVAYGLKSVLYDSQWGYLSLAVLIWAPVTFLQSLRFLMMFRAQDIRLSYWECVKLCFAGNFLNFVAVGTTGGDLVKAYYVCLHTDRRTEAVTTVVLDRIVGLTGLVAMVGVVVLLFSRDPRLSMFGSISAVFVGGVVIGSTLLVSEWARAGVRRILPRSFSRAPAEEKVVADSGAPGHGRARQLLSWSVGQIRRADETTRRLIRHKPMVLGSLLTSVILQFIALTAMQAVIYALRMPWSGARILDYYAFLGCGAVVAAIPITPQGVGTVEAFYKEFLAGGAVTVSQVLCVAMAFRLLQLFWALPGVLVTMTGAYRPRGVNALPTAPNPIR